LNEGDVLMPRGGDRLGIVAIEPVMDAEAPFHGTWGEPVLG
jgi:hypothetical protein